MGQAAAWTAASADVAARETEWNKAHKVLCALDAATTGCNYAACPALTQPTPDPHSTAIQLPQSKHSLQLLPPGSMFSTTTTDNRAQTTTTQRRPPTPPTTVTTSFFPKRCPTLATRMVSVELVVKSHSMVTAIQPQATATQPRPVPPVTINQIPWKLHLPRATFTTELIQWPVTIGTNMQ